MLAVSDISEQVRSFAHESPEGQCSCSKQPDMNPQTSFRSVASAILSESEISNPV